VFFLSDSKDHVPCLVHLYTELAVAFVLVFDRFLVLFSYFWDVAMTVLLHG